MRRVNKIIIMRMAVWGILLPGLALYCCACVSTTGAKTAQSLPERSGARQAPSFSNVTFSHAMSPFGDMLRQFGEEVGGGIVLMSGLEERAAPETAFRNTPYEEAVGVFAAGVECAYFSTPHYYMILPEGYDLLRDMDIANVLAPRYAAMTASVAFGAKTELYAALSILSSSLEITIVADNFIAESLTGELYLSDAPLGAILEALLQSARITPNAVVVESTPEYIFLRSPQNVSAPTLLLGDGTLSAEQQVLLERPVSLVLPHTVAVTRQTDRMSAPILLRDALQPLTEQLGVTIVAQRRLADIPINPCVMYNVRLGTALDLLLRQWPVAEFGYEMQEGRILIRLR